MIDMCIFCEKISAFPSQIYDENELAAAFLDGYPVTPGHMLIVPKRHVEDFWQLTDEELLAIRDLATDIANLWAISGEGISGWNFGTNAGRAAGQTVFHCHFHLIPRRIGDMEDPRGGVRGVIPEKQKY